MTIATAKIEALAQRLARVTGEDPETALERAVEERLARTAPVSRERRNDALRTFFRKMTAMPVRDEREADEIIGYGPDGLPR